MMATVPHVTSGLGLRKFQVDGIFVDTSVHTCAHTHMEPGQRSCLYRRSYWLENRRIFIRFPAVVSVNTGFDPNKHHIQFGSYHHLVGLINH